jgi:hypothetical protein
VREMRLVRDLLPTLWVKTTSGERKERDSGWRWEEENGVLCGRKELEGEPKKVQASAMEGCGGNPVRCGAPEGEKGETSTQEGAMMRTGYVAVEEGSRNRVSLV